MPAWFATRLRQIAEILEHIDEPEAVQDVLAILEAPPLALNSISRMQLYAETLPKAQECPLTPALRHGLQEDQGGRH